MPYQMKLMFEWGGGYLWCDNNDARVAFGVGPIEERLPLSDHLRTRLDELSRWHDTALNWSNPASPSPWSHAENAAFEAAVSDILPELRQHLGANYIVCYHRLDECSRTGAT